MRIEQTKPDSIRFLCVLCVLCGTFLFSTDSFAQSKLGLASLDDQRLMAELASRGLDSLLDYAFTVNNIPTEQQAGIRTLLALRELTDPNVKLTARDRQDKVKQVVSGIERALPSLNDPKLLMQQASVLITSGVERDVNTLEYWGENPKTQAQLRPIVESVIKILNRAAEQAQAAADQIADTIKAPNDPGVNKYMEMEGMVVSANYTKAMVDYYLALSIDRADPRRKEVADKAIEFLKQYDNAESEVQPIVRNRIAKLNMAKGDFEAAKNGFDSVAAGTDITPAPNAAQQYEARYFSAVCEVLTKNLSAAETELNELFEWQKTNLPADKAAQDGASAAAAMLRYRIHSAAAAGAKDDATRKTETEAAVNVLLALVKDRPELQGIIFEQLMSKLPENADMKALDPLLLQAIVRKGEDERMKSGGDAVDTEVIERAIAAARELVNRRGQPGIDPQIADNAAYLIPFLYEKLNRPADAALAYLDYAEGFKGNAQRANIALDNAAGLIGKLRSEAAEDEKTVHAYERFLPLAINEPFNRKEFAFEYARRLQKLGKPSESIVYFRMIAPDDARVLPARYFEMVALKQQLDNPAAPVDDTARAAILVDIQKHADWVNTAAEGAIANAKTDEEKTQYRLMIVRTRLLAADLARREQKDAQRTLDLLAGFEQAVSGLPGEDDLLSEALFSRVQSYMALGKNSEATDALVKLLETKEGGQGADIVFNLLHKLNADFDAAVVANDAARTRELAENRAVLSGFLVDWARNNSDPNIRKFTYRYAVFDAATKYLAAGLQVDPDERRARLEESLQRYIALQSPENVALYKETLAGKVGIDPNYPDPSVTLGIGVVQFDLGNYKDAQEKIGRLLVDRKLGTPTMIVEENGEEKVVDNDQYWEAMYKLLKSNAELSATDPAAAEALEQTKTHLKRLYIQWGDRVGGVKWKDEFAQLRQELVPEFTES
jgi:hypothetical protein